MRKVVFIINIIIVLLLVNWAVYDKELQLKSDNIIYLELAPVDPRSLMQGDYMQLRYKLAVDIENMLKTSGNSPLGRALGRLPNSDGKVLVSLDKHRVAHLKTTVIEIDDALSDELMRDYRPPKAESDEKPSGHRLQVFEANEMVIDYRVRKGRVKFASNEFFFQEGKAEQYENAKYAKFVVAENGEVILLDLVERL